MWVVGIDLGEIDSDTQEPMACPGPLSAPLAALAEFLGADGDLVAAAYGTTSPAPRTRQDREDVCARPSPECRTRKNWPICFSSTRATIPTLP